MDLAVVNDTGENQFLSGWVVMKHSGAWLGGTDQVTEGTWLWVNGTQFWSGTATGNAVNGAFTAWYPGQPDNGGTSGPDSDCLMMTWTVPNAWYDARCADFEDYICEAP